MESENRMQQSPRIEEPQGNKKEYVVYPQTTLPSRYPGTAQQPGRSHTATVNQTPSFTEKQTSKKQKITLPTTTRHEQPVRPATTIAGLPIPASEYHEQPVRPATTIAGLPVPASEDIEWRSAESEPGLTTQHKISTSRTMQKKSNKAPVLDTASSRIQSPASTISLNGSHRREEHITHYPPELMQIIESETRELQIRISQPLTLSPDQSARSRQPTVKLAHKQKTATADTEASANTDTTAPRKHKRKHRVPEMRQVTAVECGAACIAMILNYYGYNTGILAVQERCGVGRDGLSALDIIKSARLYGLRARAVSLNLDEFCFVTLPAIIHWEFNHFLVVERWSPQRVDVVDPAVGRRTLTTKEFDEGFTGVAIMLEPSESFEHHAPDKSLTVWSYMRSFLRMRKVILQILGASLVLQILGLGVPLLTEVIIDSILPAKDPNMLTLMAIGMLILVLMQGAALFLRSSLLIYLQTRIDTQMLLHFFEHLLRLPYRFFQLRLNGDLLARMNSNLAIRDLFTNQLLSSLLDGSTIIIYFLVLIFISKSFAAIALIVGGVQILLLLVSAPAIRNLTRRDLEAQGKTQGYMNEVLSGIATIKASGTEQHVFTRWEDLFFEEMNISLRLNYLSSIIGILTHLLNVLAPLLLLWLGARAVIAGTMTTGTMLALNTLVIALLTPLNSLATSAQELQTIGAHFTRVADVIGTPPEQDPGLVHTPPRLSGLIELKDVGFQYSQNTPMILQHIHATIYPKQKIALVGRTGSGKSTLGKLLIGLMTPTQGSILFDAIPLAQLNYQEVRNQFGAVLQESFIFSGSVRENISANDPDMDLLRVTEAARIAAIADDIEEMPMGYDTLVSEGGSAFSGGQRQRLALARALATHPSVLLLDEATSALDVVTEQMVEQNLHSLPCTQIIIAHRLSTIRNADMILVLDRGQIVERGTHEQLLRKQGFYTRLIHTQLQNGEIAAH